MHKAFRYGFEKMADFDPSVFGAFTAAGALGGLGESLTAAKPSWKRGLAMAGLGGTMGALEGAHLGDKASPYARAAKGVAGATLGGAIAHTAGHGLDPKRRLIATGLGALASGIPASL